ncbi:16S rRNA (cytosine967-C5)-methyltransferase [Tistlia consotensis]|uniref:16S rRNA (Cytosine967-C5)-methyltransferase n=1 Tax=Tistlia consotensis USBA 355 TaxID=560819 RepID=A0A1Y6B965_9PROT|nr:RsmB/NOP family class I SAM-dependent RNA methyltransferase [Tistlia consotensis]SME99415.1 16S rRNA (cytosine967-C5)-methyltransferase [Tistlia consotensis USBA 355]SNR76869.1 16S rRNA (cytosine967-C5)-methyltransferase [Tistlia consotensis]
MTPAARVAAAIELLGEIAATGRPADRVAADWFKARRFIGGGDRRAVSLRIWAVLRARARLGWWLARAGAAETPRAQVLAWLCLGEGLALPALERLFDGATFAPARLEERERGLAAALAGQPLDHPDQPPAVAAELPGWLHARLAAALGEHAAAELAALREEAPVDLRANAVKAGREEVRAALAREGIEAEPGRWSPWALRIDGRRPVAATAVFRNGEVEVQDEGSQLVALLADAQAGMRVCDFCAGAGGKTLALAAAMGNRGQIVACDVRGGRIDRAAQRLKRAGVDTVRRQVLQDERDPWVKKHKAGFERVLVDAPCSGSGTFRRNPEAKWRLSEAGLAELTALQARILESACRLVKPGGRLIYATCSLLPEENEAQVERFLAARPDFAVLPVAGVWAERLGGAPPAAGPFLKLLPARDGTDGFFLAVLERKGTAAEALHPSTGSG